PEGSEKLEKEYRAKASEFRALAKGERAATKTDLELIDLGVKFHVYRLTWREQTKEPGVSTRFINEVDVILKSALNSKGKAVALLEMLGIRMVVRLKELLTHEDFLVRANAALMLPLAARAGNPELAILLAEVVRDDRQNEVVRYWAVVALRELFAQTRQYPPMK